MPDALANPAQPLSASSWPSISLRVTAQQPAFDPAGLLFTKVDGSPTTASIRIEQEEDGRPLAVVTTHNAKGKARERRVRHNASFEGSLVESAKQSVRDRAIRDLLKAGFVVRPSRDTLLKLVVGTEVGPPMGLAFAVDEERGCAWIGDWGFLRRVDLQTAEVTSVALQGWNAVRQVAVESGGTPWVLAELDPMSANESRWRAPSEGGVLHAVLRVEGSAVVPVVQVQEFPRARPPIGRALSIATDGTRVFPHPEGVGIYRPEGTLERVLPLEHTTYNSACAAMDPSGRWVATTQGDGQLSLLDLQSGAETRRSGPFAGVEHLQVFSNGTVDVVEGSGARAMYRCPPDGPARKLAADSTAYTSSPDGGTLYALQRGGTCDAIDAQTGESTRCFPVLGMATSGKVYASAKALYMRTDLGVFLRVALDGSPPR